MAKVSEINLRRIAKEVGVSHMTVSRALRNQDNVAIKTREKIVEAAERLGYKSNPLVQAYTTHIRRSGKTASPTCNLALLKSFAEAKDSGWVWQIGFQEGASMRAEQLGFDLDTSINAHDLSDKRLDQMLRARGVQGVLIPFSIYFGRSTYQRSHLATVAIGESQAVSPIHTVIPDYYRNLTAAMDHLLACGHKRIGFCEHAYSMVESQGSQCGAYFFNQLRLPEKQRLRPLIGFSAKQEDDIKSKDIFLRWFEREQPDAILLTFNSALSWLEDIGVQVPKDVALAHLLLRADVADWSGMTLNNERLGAAAVDLLTSHILRNEFGIPEYPKRQYLSGKWQDGSTCIRSPKKIESDAMPSSQSHSYDWFKKNILGFDFLKDLA